MAQAKPDDLIPKCDDSIKKKLLEHIIQTEPKAPTKVTVVGCGMVGMACSISILLKVRK